MLALGLAQSCFTLLDLHCWQLLAAFDKPLCSAASQTLYPSELVHT